MNQSVPTEPSWRFLTNHGNALLCIARDPDARARDIAERVGITERAAQRIVADLIAGGYIHRTKVGRRNRYQINRHGRLRHPLVADFEIGRLVDILYSNDGAGPEPADRS